MPELDYETKMQIDAELEALSSNFFALSDGYSLASTRRSRLLRHATPYEAQFRVILKNLRLQIPDLEFISQYVIYTRPAHRDFFIADFLITSPRLIAVEIDGSSHVGRGGYDEWRTRLLQRNGVQVVRFTNHQVSRNHGGIEHCLLELLTNGGS